MKTRLIASAMRLLAGLIVGLLAVVAAAAQDGGSVPAGAGAEAGTADRASALIEVLRDPDARDGLIAELERLAAGTEAGATADTAPDAEDGGLAADAMSLGRQIAQTTQSAAEALLSNAQTTLARLQSAPDILDGLSGDEVPVLIEALRELLLVIAGTVAAFVVLRRLANALYRRMGQRAQDGNAARAVLLFGVSTLVDVGVVIVSWAVGYALGLLAIGEFGQIAIRMTLYLNAFLLVEMSKVALRMILSPAAGALRPMPLSDRAARYLNRWVGFLVALLGYGNLLIVPIINENISFIAGRATASLIALIALVIAVALVIAKRRPVARWMLGEDRGVRRTGSVATLARRWHWFALLYLVAMFVIVLTQPGEVTFVAFSGSGKIALAVILALAASKFLTGAIARGVVLPDRISKPLPLLEGRLNRFVPRVLFAIRAVIFVVVAAYTLDVLGLFDISAWLTGQFGRRFTGTTLSVVLVLLTNFILWLALSSWVDYRLNPDVGQVATARETTLLTLLRNAATITLVVITLMFVLAEIGLDIAPLLASAGVLGLAIGFGAQRMVQDIITGIFIQFENAINVGDVVTVGGVTGVVERLTIRSVSLRDLQGTYHIVSFSSVDMVSNYMRDYAYFVADIGIAYEANMGVARQAMADAFEELRADPVQRPKIRGDFEWFGVNGFGESSVDLRARIKTAPGEQWGIGRAYNEIAKRLFDERGIEIPYPHRTLLMPDAGKPAKGARRAASEDATPSDGIPDSDDDAVSTGG